MIKKINKRAILAGLLIIALLLISGCTGSVPAKGWASVTSVDNTLIFISMAGKIYSIDKTNGAQNGTPVPLTIQTQGGLLGCSSQASPIAVYTSPATQGQIVVIGGFDGRVYAYQVTEGKLRDQPKWVYPSQGTVGSSIVGGMTVSDGKVYFASLTGTVYSLDVTEGYKNWSTNLGTTIWSAPAVNSDTLFIGAFDKKLHALNIKDGSQKWTYKTEGAISETPLVVGKTVYIGGYDRAFYAIDTDSAQLKWKFPVQRDQNSPSNWFWSKPIELNNVIYAPNLDGNLYAFDAATGNLIKTYDLQNSINSSPVAIGDTIVVGATNIAKKTSVVYGIDTTTKTVKAITTFQEAIDAPFYTTNGLAYIHTARDNFYSLNPQNGALSKFSLNAGK